MVMLSFCALVSYAQTTSIESKVSLPVSKQAKEKSIDKPIDGHLYEITYTLNFARELGFNKVVDLLESEQYQKAIHAIEKKTGSGFSWGTEATNGYQYGFFLKH